MKRGAWRAALFLAALVVVSACRGGGGEVAGRWERVGQPTEWMRFEKDGTFTGRSYMETAPIRGTYRQHGDTVTATSTYGHTGTLVLHDSLLVMQDGTRYRRAAPGR